MHVYVCVCKKIRRKNNSFTPSLTLTTLLSLSLFNTYSLSPSPPPPLSIAPSIHLLQAYVRCNAAKSKVADENTRRSLNATFTVWLPLFKPKARFTVNAFFRGPLLRLLLLQLLTNFSNFSVTFAVHVMKYRCAEENQLDKGGFKRGMATRNTGRNDSKKDAKRSTYRSEWVRERGRECVRIPNWLKLLERVIFKYRYRKEKKEKRTSRGRGGEGRCWILRSANLTVFLTPKHWCYDMQGSGLGLNHDNAETC